MEQKKRTFIGYYYEHLISRRMGLKEYTGKIIRLRKKEDYDIVCQHEQEIIDRKSVDSWHRPFKLFSDGYREYFKPKMS